MLACWPLLDDPVLPDPFDDCPVLGSNCCVGKELDASDELEPWLFPIE